MRPSIERSAHPVRVALAIVAAAVWIFVGGGSAAAGPTGDGPDDLAARLDAKLAAIVAAGAPGAMARVRAGSMVWRSAQGLASMATHRAAGVDDVWRVASVTKLIAAHIAVALEGEGVIDLDDRLEQFDSALGKRAGRLTLRSLLDHSSRTPEYLEQSVFGETARSMQASVTAGKDPEALLAAALAGRWERDPMAEMQYANTNYVLLQHALEAATSQSFEALLRSRLVEPLALTRTGMVGREGNLPPNHLAGHIRDDTRNGPFTSKKTLIDVTVHPYFHGADGGLYTSLDDLSKLMDHIWTANRIGGRNLARLMPTLRSDHDGFYRYGYGVMAVDLPCGAKIFGHEGYDLGSVTYAFATRDNDRQLVLVSNLSIDNNDALDAALVAVRDAVFCR